jgi:hypothetical protein
MLWRSCGKLFGQDTWLVLRHGCLSWAEVARTYHHLLGSFLGHKVVSCIIRLSNAVSLVEFSEAPLSKTPSTLTHKVHHNVSHTLLNPNIYLLFATVDKLPQAPPHGTLGRHTAALPQVAHPQRSARHKQGRCLLLRRYRDTLIAEKTRLEQRAEVLKGEITKQHRVIVGCKKSLIQQRECFEAMLEECREECRQEVEYNDMLSMQLTRRGSELSACWRDLTNKEVFIQSLTDIMMETLGVKDTDEVYKMQVLTVGAQEILGALCVGLCSEVKLHKVQREKST